MSPSDTALYAPETASKRVLVARVEEGPVDVLILTALQDELEAVLALGDDWSERQDRGGFPYHRRRFIRGGRRPLVIAAEWLGKMGTSVTAIRGSAFLRELDPGCVAMCGICAGMRGETALGDVIIADKLYSFDEGQLVAEPGKEPELQHDIKTYDLHPLWTMNAASLKREIDLPALQKRRPPSKEAQARWLLHAQYTHAIEGGPAPNGHAEQESACPDWTEILDAAVDKGLLALKAGTLSLTAAGREQVLNERTRFRKKLPRDPDLHGAALCMTGFNVPAPLQGKVQHYPLPTPMTAPSASGPSPPPPASQSSSPAPKAGSPSPPTAATSSAATSPAPSGTSSASAASSRASWTRISPTSASLTPSPSSPSLALDLGAPDIGDSKEADVARDALVLLQTDPARHRRVGPRDLVGELAQVGFVPERKLAAAHPARLLIPT